MTVPETHVRIVLILFCCFNKANFDRSYLVKFQALSIVLVLLECAYTFHCDMDTIKYPVDRIAKVVKGTPDVIHKLHQFASVPGHCLSFTFV